MVRAVARTLSIAALVLCAAASAAPRAIYEGPRPDCPTPQALAAALRTFAPAEGGTVYIRRLGRHHVFVRYSVADGARPMARSLDARDCASMPDAIALLVRSWANTRLTTPPPPDDQRESTPPPTEPAAPTARLPEQTPTQDGRTHSTSDVVQAVGERAAASSSGATASATTGRQGSVVALAATAHARRSDDRHIAGATVAAATSATSTAKHNAAVRADTSHAKPHARAAGSSGVESPTTATQGHVAARADPIHAPPDDEDGAGSSSADASATIVLPEFTDSASAATRTSATSAAVTRAGLPAPDSAFIAPGTVTDGAANPGTRATDSVRTATRANDAATTLAPDVRATDLSASAGTSTSENPRTTIVAELSAPPNAQHAEDVSPAERRQASLQHDPSLTTHNSPEPALRPRAVPPRDTSPAEPRQAPLHHDAPPTTDAGAFSRSAPLTVLVFAAEGALIGRTGDITASTAATLAGGIQVETALGSRFFAGLQGRAETPRVHRRFPGKVQAELAALDAVVRYAFHAPGAHGFELCGGLGMQRIAASSSGYTVNRAVILFDPELTGSVQWRQEVMGGFFFTLFAGGELRLRTETLEIAPFGTVTTLPAAGVRAGIGVGWAAP
ncbi:MAG: hypothetical protein IRZ16_02540 [Myxococcaceae bacterium]|nr:hypothetical protein [Myxococcaceae bacterium]